MNPISKEEARLRIAELTEKVNYHNFLYYQEDTSEISDFEFRSEEHTSELQSRENLVCRLLLEKKNWTQKPCVRSQQALSTAKCSTSGWPVAMPRRMPSEW